MKFENLTKPAFAVDYLADRLIDGTLVLFLGSGASSGFGLPGWIEFANKFCRAADLDFKTELTSDNSADELERTLDRAIRKIGNSETRKVDIVKDVLYANPGFLDSRLAISQELLIAVASLLIGRKRGHVSRVVTFNYDSMLEWFLGVFGMSTRTIHALPSLEGSEDVRIYHPHGYVPHPSMEESPSDFLIIGSMDANNRAGDETDPWWAKERSILESGVGLYVGLSLTTFRDRAFQPHLGLVRKKLLEKGKRPLGIWLFLDEKNEFTVDDINECLDYLIVPIVFTNRDLIPEFILKISQAALSKIKEFC